MRNRQLRTAVREGSHVQPVDDEVSRVDCEHALVEVQLKHGECFHSV